MADTKTYTVFIVEDNDLNLEMLQRRLEKQGFRIVSAQTGSQVEAVLAATRPDIILMDLNLPEVDGWTLAKRLKQHDSRYAAIPLIAVTAHAMRGDREKALAAGFDDYVSKPLDFKALLRCIHAQLTLTSPT